MKKEDIAVYPAIFELENSSYTIIFPDLPGCISCAESEYEAVIMARDALGAWLAACESLGKEPPKPSAIIDIQLGENQSICLIDAWIPIFREENRTGSVKKNLTVPAWLNALAEKEGLNFSQILQAGLKSTLGIYNR